MAYVASLEFSNSPTLKGCRVKCGGVSTTGDGTKMHSLRLDKEKIPKEITLTLKNKPTTFTLIRTTVKNASTQTEDLDIII